MLKRSLVIPAASYVTPPCDDPGLVTLVPVACIGWATGEDPVLIIGSVTDVAEL